MSQPPPGQVPSGQVPPGQVPPGQTPGGRVPSGEAPGRDRDAAGRPRNARPRDGLGRPLPRGEQGDDRIPDDLSLPPAESLAYAQRLLDSGRPFHAHEVLEASWKSAPEAERDMWQGLAQIAVGLTHAARGNATGAATLLRRGGRRVARYAGAPPHGVAAAQVAAHADGLATRIERDGLAWLGSEPPTVQLTAPGP